MAARRWWPCSPAWASSPHATTSAWSPPLRGRDSDPRSGGCSRTRRVDGPGPHAVRQRLVAGLIADVVVAGHERVLARRACRGCGWRTQIVCLPRPRGPALQGRVSRGVVTDGDVVLADLSGARAGTARSRSLRGPRRRSEVVEALDDARTALGVDVAALGLRHVARARRKRRRARAGAAGATGVRTAAADLGAAGAAAPSGTTIGGARIGDLAAASSSRQTDPKAPSSTELHLQSPMAMAPSKRDAAR